MQSLIGTTDSSLSMLACLTFLLPQQNSPKFGPQTNSAGQSAQQVVRGRGSEELGLGKVGHLLFSTRWLSCSLRARAAWSRSSASQARS